MLQKPKINYQEIIKCLDKNYNLNVSTLEFLPLGADKDTVVYRAVADEGAYFVKLRSDFDEMSVLVPAFLYEQGVEQIIAPLKTESQDLWVDFKHFTVTVFPFVEGKNASDVDMSDKHMVEFGQALKKLHSAKIPSILENRVQHENYSGRWREKVRKFQGDIQASTYSDPVSKGLSELLKANKAKIDKLVNGAASLANILLEEPRPFVLCHADIHVWNVLIDAEGKFYIIDWDTIILAPIERDLMFIGSGIGGKWDSPREEALFYKGYGEVEIDLVGLAYYRMERIVEDIAVYCETIFLSNEGEDRETGLGQLKSQFKSGGIVDIALETAKRLPLEYQF